MNLSTQSRTLEERIWAAVGHASGLAFGVGAALPLLAWNNWHKKSPYAAFQSLQALGYQVLGYTVWMILVLLVTIIWIFASVPITMQSGPGFDQPGEPFFFWVAGFFVLIFGSLLAFMILPIIAAVATALGKDFNYPFLGKRLAAYLRYDPLAEPGQAFDDERVDRWLAAMGHFSVIIFIWGLITPALTWVLFKGRSPLLTFQAAQAAIYQAIGTVLYGIFTACYMAGSFAMLPFLANSDGMNYSGQPPVFLLVYAMLVMCCGGCFTLAMPLFQVGGQWAGFRLLRGHDFRFPLIAPLAGRFTSNQNKSGVSG